MTEKPRVFCGGCRHYESGDVNNSGDYNKCLLVFRYEYDHLGYRTIHGYASDKNNNNDCKDFNLPKPSYLSRKFKEFTGG